MPSTEETNLLDDKIFIEYKDKQLKIDLYDNPLTKKFLAALNDNLKQKRVLEKNFCFLGWAHSQRNLDYLVKELNENIAQINSYNFVPAYEYIHPFVADDFQYSSNLPIGRTDEGKEMTKPGLRLKHDSCNILHRHFEELQGSAWQLSQYYKQADYKTKYAIRQLNNICHEIESWVNANRKFAIEPEWSRPSQITTFLNAPRHKLLEEDYELFKHNRYDRELGGVYLHWSQVGKTLYEVFRDENAPMMTKAMCSEINHQKYYSGEFDIEWGQTITEDEHEFKKIEMSEYRSWLADNGYDWDDPKLSLGYIKLGQIDLVHTFGDKNFLQIYDEMKNNLNIKKISVTSGESCEYPYTLDSDDWKQIQIDFLKEGYESRGLC